MATDGRGRTSMGSRIRTWLLPVLAPIVAVAACGPLMSVGSTPNDTDGSIPVAAAPVVGTWVTEVVADDLRAAGVTDPGLIDENSGRFTWTLANDGTWEQVQEPLGGGRVTNPVWRGTWAVEDDVLVQTVSFPPQYAGDLVQLRFVAGDDALQFTTLTPRDDPILIVVNDGHPWQRATP
jgi:hypothetical protein